MKIKYRFFLFLLCVGCFSFIDQTVQADIPEHVTNLTGLFETKSGSSSTYDSQGIVTVTPNTTHQIGSVWSTDKNLLDFNESFDLFAYVNFTAQAYSGDGMALVFQAQSDSPQWFTYNGASLGVYGSQTDHNTLGIPNSLAIEFDLYQNASDGDGHFDGNDPTIVGQHVAYTWPGNADSYMNWNSGWIITSPQRYLTHNAVINRNLATGEWIKIEVRWNAEEKTFKYIFDNNQEISIPYQTLYDNVLSKNNLVLWGFTGATGNYSSEQRIVFGQVPALVVANTAVDVVSKRRGPLDSGGIIYSGEEVTVTYTAEYEKGKQDWNKIISTFDIPTELENISNIEVTSWNGDTKGETKTLPVDKIVDGKYTLDEVENQFNLGAHDGVPTKFTFSFTGQLKANPVSQSLTFSALYNGENAVYETDEFTLKPAISIKPEVTIDQKNVKITDATTQLDLSGTWSNINKNKYKLNYYLDGVCLNENAPWLDGSKGNDAWNYSVPNLSGISYGTHQLAVVMTEEGGKTDRKEIPLQKVSLPVITKVGLEDGGTQVESGQPAKIVVTWHDNNSASANLIYQLNDQPRQTLENISNPVKGEENQTTITIDTTDLPLGTYKMNVGIINQEGEFSPDYAVLTFEIYGSLNFVQIPQDFLKTDLKLSSGLGLQKIDNFSAVSVRDTREGSHEWQLSVKLNGQFTNEQNQMINENFLFYKTTSGELKSINLEDVTLLRYTSKDSSIITLDQTGSAGFYIQPKDWFYKGTYQTTLNWSLSDVPTE